jgi:predicted small integral membrane protein
MGYWWENQRERDHWEDQDVDRWVDNIKIDLLETGWGDVDWIGLAKDRNRWRAVVNSVLNLRVP